jgi:choline dehydrogenase-like flavoprotein
VLIDARQIDDGAQLRSDLVVVGAGMAGITIVDRLLSSGLSMCLIEGGGFSPELRAQRLVRGESVGTPYFRLDACRYREFGGSGNHWGGWCWPLNPIDFEQRDWLPWSGWPIDRTELDPFYAAAANLLRLSTSRFDLAARPAGMPAPLDMSDSSFENTIVQYSPETSFGATFRDRITNASDVTTLLHANVAELLLDPDGRRIVSVVVRTLDGRSFRVNGRAVVLAAGAIENARLLLVSRGTHTAGVGNAHDVAGRFFMEHLHAPAGHFRARAEPVDRDFYRKATYDGRLVRGMLTPTADAQAHHRLPACSIAIEPASYTYGTPFDGWAPVLRTAPDWARLQLQRRGHQDAAGKLKGVVDHAWNARRRAETWRYARAARARDAAVSGSKRGQLLSLYVRSEQTPDPSSRVSLSDRKDAFGVPQPRLDWRLQASDTEHIVAWLAELDLELRRRSLGHVVGAPEGWEQRIIGGPHHMGTTRMSADPRKGVVNAQCRVHSVDNLYVAGSSVFTTGGHANPTFTLVALAIRLADELQRTLAPEHHLPTIVEGETGRSARAAGTSSTSEP